MAEVVRFRQISVDIARVMPGGRAEWEFFQPKPLGLDGSTPLTDLPERAAVRWLMLHQPFRHLIFDELNLPASAYYRLEVVEPFYASGENEFDLVACPRDRPDLAIAFQWKRVKVVIVDEGHEKVNRLNAVQGGVVQANKLYSGKHAFHQTYLVVLMLVDASAQEERNIPSRGIRSLSTPTSGDTSKTTFRQLIEFPGRDELDKDVGILLVEAVQPSRLSADVRSTLRVNAYRQAERRDQPDSTTNRVVELLKAG